MQTSLDRWLRKKFAIETHVFTISDPGKIPKGIKRIELGKQLNSKYMFEFVTHHDQRSQELIDLLRSQQQTFTTQVIERKTLAARLLAPKGRSFTYSTIGLILLVATTIQILIFSIDAYQSKRYQEQIDSIYNFFNGKS